MTDTTPETATVEVTQADRDAFAEIVLNCTGAMVEKMLLAGAWDDDLRMLAIARHRTRATRQDGLRDVAIDLAASLAAAISLLEKGGKAAKKAAPSDKMFDQMIRDYKRSLTRARADLSDSSTREESGADDDCVSRKAVLELVCRAVADALDAKKPVSVAVIEAINAAPGMPSTWRPIETCPPEDLFIGAVHVTDNRTGASWWERHLLALDDETGDIHADYEQGWQLADYSWWLPFSTPPIPALSASPEGEGK